ncbi:MAG: 2OG-Fe(II) oxygenase [Gammaproteobacteria bacterium]|nr:2OG-Fe(II) oxygenase [Gammaproteobacteria bacterium]
MAGLMRGDRIPNFKRYDHAGTAYTLHNELHTGQSIILLILPAECADLMTTLTEAFASDALPKNTECIGLIEGTPATIAKWQPTPFTLLADDNTLIQHLIGAKPADGSARVIALDANLRILERFEVTSDHTIDSLRTHVTNIYEDQPAGSAAQISQQAPVLIIPRVFDPEFCSELIHFFEHDRHGGEPSGVIHFTGDKQEWRADPDTKIRRDVYFEEGNEYHEEIKRLVAQRVLPEIELCFNFRVTRHDPFRLICYDSSTGGYFRPHRDNVTPDVAHRRFAMTINLNTGDYEGGQLCFPEYGNNLYLPELGGAVVFSCSLVHEARDVTQGRRYAIVGFFFDEAAASSQSQ